MSQRLGRNKNSISLLEKKVINGLRTEQDQQETKRFFFGVPSGNWDATTSLYPTLSSQPKLFLFQIPGHCLLFPGFQTPEAACGNTHIVCPCTFLVHNTNYSSSQFPLCSLLWKQLTGFHSTFTFQLLMREPKLNQNVVNLKLIIAQAESNNLLYLIMNKCE